MNASTRGLRVQVGCVAWLVPALFLQSLPASAACPAGQTELLPNIRALRPAGIAMRNATDMQFSATSWNSGDAKLHLIARNPVTDPATGQKKQPVDQRIYCTGGGFYDRSAGMAEYHAAHNHVHYNDYANYILELADGSQQNPRKGTKTTFCIMDTTGANTQLKGAAGSPVYNFCPSQDPGFNTQGMSIGWGDTYGAALAGQSLLVGDLQPGMYRLRHVFDPKNLLVEQSDGDNESCELIEIGDGANGRYVADRGSCSTPPVRTISSIVPNSARHGTCVAVTITGSNLVPELKLTLSGGTGPLPNVKATTFAAAGNFVKGTLCVPQARGGRHPKLGNDPVWDVQGSSVHAGTNTNVLPNTFRVTP